MCVVSRSCMSQFHCFADPLSSPRCNRSSHCRPSLPCRIGYSWSDTSLHVSTRAPQAQGRLGSLQQRLGKSFRVRSVQDQDVQSSAELQALTGWLIDKGVEGINNDGQKVEIYQYGKDGRGLRATTVLQSNLQGSKASIQEACYSSLNQQNSTARSV